MKFWPLHGSDNLKPLVIYHSPCADGFSAAWCFHHKDPQGYDFYPAQHGNPPPIVLGRDVYIVDFSYPADTLLMMAAEARSIHVWDHHKSAQADLEGRREELAKHGVLIEFDMNRSGAGLTWDMLFPRDARPVMLNYIEDRDLWRFALPGSKAVGDYVFSNPYLFETWDTLMMATKVEDAIAGGIVLRRAKDKELAEMLPILRGHALIAGHVVPAVNLPYVYASDAGHILCEGQAFAAVWTQSADLVTVSLRSTDAGLDVSKIAKYYGGGGHRNAAGFRLHRVTDADVIARMFDPHLRKA
jgi:hypothetical protein